MSNRIKIFLIDDNEYTRAQLARQLHQLMDCNVLTFPSASSFYKGMYRTPDVIISDYYLTENDSNTKNTGGEILAKIKKNYKDIPVILYSSKANAETIVDLIKKGASDFVSKTDFNGAEFGQKISEITYRELQRIEDIYKKRRTMQTLFTLFVALSLGALSCFLYLPKMFPAIAILPIVVAVIMFLISKKSAKKRNHISKTGKNHEKA